MTDDKVRIRCPHCTRMFRHKAYKIRDGFQINCENCNRLLTLNRDSEDPFIRRALRSAQDIRTALEARPASSSVHAMGSIGRT